MWLHFAFAFVYICCFTLQNVSIYTNSNKVISHMKICYHIYTQICPFVMRFASKKQTLSSIQMNFTSHLKCGSGDVTRELRFILYRFPHIFKFIFLNMTKFATYCDFLHLSIQRLKQNRKLLDTDRKFYNHQCNPFDIAAKKHRGNFLLNCVQFIELRAKTRTSKCRLRRI